MKVHAPFCKYEHLGGCADTLTHRAPYWKGEARRRFGKWAHWCANHAGQASHILGIRPTRAIARSTVRKSDAEQDGAASGRAAFAAGLTRTPVHDPAVTKLVSKYSPNTDKVNAMLAAWLAAWDRANLSQGETS
jgi:hypothetical protein